MHFILSLIFSVNMAFATTTKVKLEGMNCSACVEKLEKVISGIPEAKGLNITVKVNKVTIEDSKNKLSSAQRQELIAKMKAGAKEYDFAIVSVNGA